MNTSYKIKPPTKWESRIIRFMIILGVFSILVFLSFFFRPEFRGYLPLYILLSFILLYGALKKCYLWYHYWNISVPTRPKLKEGLKVDVLTTYFPGEPYEMTIRTLEAIQNIKYPHTAYLCDEANDPFLIKECKRLGVVHVTRDNRIDAKAGNINNALRQATGEICLVLDPDHVPEPDFLHTVLPHFEDEAIGFVQVVQAYYNKPHTLVARGASEQTFQFYGPMMMSMNSYGTVNAIGANCTFRRAALDSIGGHAPGLAEDMHTAMLLHAKGWKSIYVPELVAKGLAPVDLTSYFKQQLKWSRGVFELLYTVYPKQYKNFTLRQRLHYALLPLHYLIGFIYLISFTIPIVSLLFSKMPWTGDILYFLIASIPVFMSSLLIRTYIQKWVIEKNDRGFHIIGGLLQLITWWVFILGVVYTFMRKKVPYLPTPKSEEATNLKITIPNMIVAILSIFAVGYGLHRDLTPFSLIMAFFATLNAVFMLFSVYLASRVTNRNKILRTALERRTIDSLKKIKHKFIAFTDVLFSISRYLALPLLLGAIFFSAFAYIRFENAKWDTHSDYDIARKEMNYLGIFKPAAPGGITNLEKVRLIEKEYNIDFGITSFYIAWGDSVKNQLPGDYIRRMLNMGASPLITWEPWISTFKQKDSMASPTSDKGVFKLISDGYFDDYIQRMAMDIKEVPSIVFLRFAHEFDNPSYPWVLKDGNTAEDFKVAWRHVHHIFYENEVHNVRWVWNPWKPEVMQDTYPGDDYVDWVGVTLLNYGSRNDDGQWYSFNELYAPFDKALQSVSSRPVMLAEFGSLAEGGNARDWVHKAMEDIENRYRKIKAVVFFNSAFDANFPQNASDKGADYLDWTSAIDSRALSESRFFHAFNPYDNPEMSGPVFNFTKRRYQELPLQKGRRGIHYKKADDWFDNNYIASKDELNEDFAKMNEIGINTIIFEHSEIYAHNVIKYAAANNIDIIYSFSVPKNMDFIQGSGRLKRLTKNILETIETVKDEPHVLGWNLGGDPWAQLPYDYPDDFVEQRKAYVQWVKALADAIKEIDSGKPLQKTIKLGENSRYQVMELLMADAKVDAFGIDRIEGQSAEDFFRFAETYSIPYFMSGIQARHLTVFAEKITFSPVYLANWQNQWETGNIGTDGLLDFNGNKKPEYLTVGKIWGELDTESDLPRFEIIRPAKPLLEDLEVSYTVSVYRDGNWQYPKTDGDLKFDWRLLRYSPNGNILAMKKIGSGVEVAIDVPPNYENYRIMLTLTRGNLSSDKQMPLNTPAPRP